MDLKNFFEAKSIAVIGASRNPRKIGHVILKNFIDAKYNGKLHAVNINAEEVLGLKAFKSVREIKEDLDLAIIATPAETVLQIVEECSSKGIKDIIIISGGFSEVGNAEEEEKLKELIKKKKLQVIGPNCLGVYDAYSKLDTIFNPQDRMERPKSGGISFICQSGAVGVIMLDMMAKENYGLRRFVSYGNAAGLDESDFIEFLGKDEKTKVICLYIEGVHDGIKFLEVTKRVSKKKPIIAIKAGLTEEGVRAVKSHTGSLAGSGEVYKGVFRQAGIIMADTLEELFDYARILEKSKPPKGNKVQVITNGGGLGVITVDTIARTNLQLAEFEKSTKERLRSIMPSTVNITNPLDLVGDATDERYKIAIEASLDDNNIDIIFVIILPQTPAITNNILNVMRELNKNAKKPICSVVSGGSFAETIRRELEEEIPSFAFPENAVLAVRELVEYYEEIKQTAKNNKVKK